MSTYFDEASDGEDTPTPINTNYASDSTGASEEPAVIIDPAVVLTQVAEFKASGNSHFSAGEYEESVAAYALAITTLKKNSLPADCILHLNRSAAYLALKNYVKALHDANIAAELDSTQWKAHWRKGVALMSMSKRAFRTRMAVKAFEECLGCASLPANKQAEVRSELSKATRLLEKQDAETPPADLSRCAPS